MDSWRRIVLAATPVAAFVVGVPLIDRSSLTLAGFPIVLVWIAGWIAITPAFVWGIGRVERRW